MSGVWFDHAATSLPRRPEAIDALNASAHKATPGRGLHGASRAGRDHVEAARTSLLRATGLKGVVCLLPGTTAALGQAILGLTPAPRAIALGPMAHNALRRPAHQACERIWTLPHDEHGHVDVAAAAAEWPADIDLVCIEHASNVTGLVQPVADIVTVAHRRGAKVVVDAAQTAGVLPAPEMGDADLVAFGAHKAFAALPGVGALVVRDPSLSLTPRAPGGTGFDARAETMPAALPDRLEAGTLPLALIDAWRAAAEAPHTDRLERGALVDVLLGAGVDVVGEGTLGVVSGRVSGSAPQEVEQMLDEVFGIGVRAGLHCAPAAHAVLGTLDEGGLVRFSMGWSTTAAELDELGSALGQLKRALGRAA